MSQAKLKVVEGLNDKMNKVTRNDLIDFKEVNSIYMKDITSNINIALQYITLLCTQKSNVKLWLIDPVYYLSGRFGLQFGKL